jgi:hypothetical protein
MAGVEISVSFEALSVRLQSFFFKIISLSVAVT